MSLPISRISELIDLFKILYTEHDTKRQEVIVNENYVKDARFMDPLVSVTGSNVMAQFKSLSYVFPTIQWIYKKHEVTQEVPGQVALLSIDNEQHYTVRGTSKTIVLPVKTELRMVKQTDAENKEKWLVEEHKDLWLTGSVLEKIPLYPSYGRPFVGYVSSWLIKLFV